jgi:hypothetical protein
MAGQVVGGALGTGGAESGSMAGMAGQMIGGALGTKGGKDGSFGATMGQTIGGKIGTVKPPEKPEPAPPVPIKEQIPGLIGSI